MIKYVLKCDNGHAFESWFGSASAYDSLKSAGHVSCAQCGSGAVKKAIMAPSVSTGETKEMDAQPSDADVPNRLSPEAAQALATMRKNVEENATYVGGNFAREARAQFLGDEPDRPIWGEANPEQAKSLMEDGVPVAPLPFIPTRKAN